MRRSIVATTVAVVSLALSSQAWADDYPDDQYLLKFQTSLVSSSEQPVVGQAFTLQFDATASEVVGTTDYIISLRGGRNIT